MHGAICSAVSTRTTEVTVDILQASILTQEGSLGESSHVVGPVVARDTQIFEQYLPPTNPEDRSAGHRYSIDSLDAYKPVYHATIPRRRPSPSNCDCSRNRQADWMEILKPLIEKLLHIYFDEIHCCFPVMMESCVLTRVKNKEQLPPSFMANLAAYILSYWDLSQPLSLCPKPDQDYAWQIALSANLADLQKRDIATLVSTILNIAGRPSTNLTGNATNIARVVAMSHGMGLNHDPTEWKIHDREKKLRWLAWWAVLNLDRSYGFCLGTPPYITAGHYDVPLPTVALLTECHPGSVKHLRAAECYIALCQLTEIVGDILPLLYHIRAGTDALAAQQVAKSEVDLRTWITGLPLSLCLLDLSRSHNVPGLTNLQLSYLAVKMLLARIAWHDVSSREPDPHPSWLSNCQDAADHVVQFTLSLRPIEFRGFWLPHNSHHFTSAVTLLLRCALQTSNNETRQQCMKKARALMDFLRRAKDENDWDMAEACLSTMDQVLGRIEEALSRTKIHTGKGSPSQEQHKHAAPDADGTYMLDPFDSGHFGGARQMSIEELFPEIFAEFTETEFTATAMPDTHQHEAH